MNEQTQEQKNTLIKNTSRFSITFSTILLAVLFFIIGFSVGKSQVKNNITFDLAQSKNADKSVDFDLFWDVWKLLEKKYVDHDVLDKQKMIYGAINGMLASTDDPYTVFLDPKAYQSLYEDLEGSFEGIGAEVGIKNNVLTVIAPLSGTPAEKAGLRARDKIIEIEGKSTASMSIDEAVDKMHGKKGTELHIKIFRQLDQDETETKNITIIRDVIHVDSIRVEIDKNRIAHMRITQFGDNTVKEFDESIKFLQKHNVKGVVIDVRNNPGGILQTAIRLSSAFLKNHDIVVIEENAQKKKTNHYTVGSHALINMPVVVLINNGSASASEIMAGALRENRSDIVIVGEKSYGKGSVQELIPIGKTAAKITVAKWLTPNGNQINKKGIDPDIVIEYTNDDYKNDRDPQLEKAKEILQQKINKK